MKEFKAMKIYVDGRSAEVQKKLFELGYKWTYNPRSIISDHWPFLYTNEFGNIYFGNYMNLFVENEAEEVTVDELLSMTKAEQKHQFKPFEKVLVRDASEEQWTAAIYSHYDNYALYRGNRHHVASVAFWKYCIPYKGNEHLLGTTNEPS